MSIMRSASVVEWWDRLTKQAPNRKSWRRQCDLASHVHAYNVFVSCYSVVLLCAFVPVSVLIRIPEQMNWSIDRLTDWAVGDESSRAVCRGQRPTQVYQRIVCLGASASGNRGGPNPQFFLPKGHTRDAAGRRGRRLAGKNQISSLQWRFTRRQRGHAPRILADFQLCPSFHTLKFIRELRTFEFKLYRVCTNFKAASVTSL